MTEVQEGYPTFRVECIVCGAGDQRVTLPGFEEAHKACRTKVRRYALQVPSVMVDVMKVSATETRHVPGRQIPGVFHQQVAEEGWRVIGDHTVTSVRPPMAVIEGLVIPRPPDG